VDVTTRVGIRRSCPYDGSSSPHPLYFKWTFPSSGRHANPVGQTWRPTTTWHSHLGVANEAVHPPPQVANPFQALSNPHVHPKIRNAVWPALEKNGARSTLRTLLNFGPAAGSQVKFAGVIINDAQCQEFVVAGRCADRRCSRKHDPSYTPTVDQVDKFIGKITPIITYVLANDNAALDRVKKRMRLNA
jgi:hypothetical protein